MKIYLDSLIKAALILVGAMILAAIVSGAADAQTRRKAGISYKPKTQSARIEVTRLGYEPVIVRLRRGVPARITFLRTTEATCATEIVFPDYSIRRELPLNQAVVVQLTPRSNGEFTFTCGMNMNRGKLIVR